MGSQGSAALTLDDFLALCEAAPEGVRYEAVGGTAVMMAGASPSHQLVVLRLAMLMHANLPAGLVLLPAPLDWVLWQVPLTVRQPDIVVITEDQFEQKPLMSPPVLVVEVLSPTSRVVDLREKRAEYARAGAAHYWVVDLEVPSIEALVLAGDSYRTAALAKGGETFTVDRPFPVTVAPDDLTRKGGGPWAPKATQP